MLTPRSMTSISNCCSVPPILGSATTLTLIALAGRVVGMQDVTPGHRLPVTKVPRHISSLQRNDLELNCLVRNKSLIVLRNSPVDLRSCAGLKRELNKVAPEI